MIIFHYDFYQLSLIAEIGLNKRITYNNIEYPDWSISVGWACCIFSISFIPLHMGYRLLYLHEGDLIEVYRFNFFHVLNILEISHIFRELNRLLHLNQSGVQPSSKTEWNGQRQYFMNSEGVRIHCITEMENEIVFLLRSRISTDRSYPRTIC